jgi:hypothetical protein
MSNKTPKKHKRSRTERDRARERERDRIGPKEPPPETALYVKCPMCDGQSDVSELTGAKLIPCICSNGYIETGYTQERYDRLVKKTDKLLLALDEALRELNPAERVNVLRANGYTADDVEDARTRV